MADVTDFAKELVSLVKRARYSFTVWVVCLIVLVVPLPGFLRLDSIRNDYGQYVGIIGLSALVLWIVEIVLLLWDGRKRRRNEDHLSREQEQERKMAEHRLREEKEKRERDVLGHLDSLSKREALIFSNAIKDGSQTVFWSNDDEMGPLIAKGLMERVQIENKPYSKPYHLPRFVWNYINQPNESEKIKARASKID